MVTHYLSQLSIPTYLYEFAHNSSKVFVSTSNDRQKFWWQFSGNPALGSYHRAEVITEGNLKLSRYRLSLEI